MSALHRFAALALALAPLAPSAEAQAVLVLWGDSIVCGFGADARAGTPYGQAPFGEPVADAFRWDEASQRWTELTATQNHQGTGADLAYGAAAAWLSLNRGEGPVYVVALGIPGSDVHPEMNRAQSSWAPGLVGGALERFIERNLRPALATLPSPRVEWICGSAGNNMVPDWGRFGGHLRATWRELLAVVPGTPATMMVRSYRRSDIEARAAVQVSGHGVVDLDPLPFRAGGLLPDRVHLTHFGNVVAGARVTLAGLTAPRAAARTAQRTTARTAAPPAPAPH